MSNKPAMVKEPSPVEIKPHEIIRARRNALGISLEKVKEDTHISQKYIQALEEGNYGVFPAKVYLRGFFLAYCKYLGVENMHSLLESVLETRPPAAGAEKKEEPRAAQKHMKNESKSRREQADGAWARFSLWMLEGQNKILVFVVLPAVLLGGFFSIYSYVKYRQHRSQPSALHMPELLGHDRMVAGQKPAVPSLVPVNPKATEGRRMNLELAAKNEPGWVQVEVDQAIVFQGILPAGQKRSFTAGESVKLRLGNPKAMEIKVNNHSWPLSPQELEKVPLNVTITAEQAAAVVP